MVFKKSHMLVLLMACGTFSVPFAQAGWFSDNKSKLLGGAVALGTALWARKKPEQAKNTLNALGRGLPLAASVFSGYYYLSDACGTLFSSYKDAGKRPMSDLGYSAAWLAAFFLVAKKWPSTEGLLSFGLGLFGGD